MSSYGFTLGKKKGIWYQVSIDKCNYCSVDEQRPINIARSKLPRIYTETGFYLKGRISRVTNIAAT